MEILGGFIIFVIHDDNNDKNIYLKYFKNFVLI